MPFPSMEIANSAMSATPIVPPAQHENVAEAVAKAPLFQDLPSAAVNAIADCAECRRYGPGQTVLAQGQYDGEEFFVVLDGRLRVSNVNVGTGAVTVEDYGPNDIFALEFALAEAPAAEIVSKLAVTAEEELNALAVDAQAFRKIAGQRPSLMRNVATYFASVLCEQRFKSTLAEAEPGQRVLAALLNFAERDGVSGSWRVERMPKHRELADVAGVEEAAAAGAVASLIQAGVARRDYPGLVICDFERFTELAGQR